MHTAAVILSYNHPGITKDCVVAALQFFAPEKIILVHNGSQKVWVNGLKNDFQQITHLEFEDNTGFSGGANRGINFAFENGAENVLFLSNDTRLVKYDLDDQQNSKFILAPQVELRNTGKVHSLGGDVNLWRGKLRHLTRKEDSWKLFYIPGAAFVIGKTAWTELVGFDESLGSYWEDVDLSLRAKKTGVALSATDKIVIKHAIGKTCGGDPFYTLFSFHRNRRRVSLRHGGFWSRISFSFVYTGETLGKLFKFTFRGDFSRVKLLLKASFS